MMVVITVTNCPPKLRGDLSRWLIEIDTGVFVGNLNARVRDAVWDRVTENIKNGSATIAYSTNNEQKLNFRIHNSDWEPLDYDGIQLVRRKLPIETSTDDIRKTKIMQRHMARLSQLSSGKTGEPPYVVIDLETTGLGTEDSILEFGALLIQDGQQAASYSCLVRTDAIITKEVTALTGIDQKMMETEGIPLPEALQGFLDFCGTHSLIGHHVQFDLEFLQRACKQTGIAYPQNQIKDTMRLAKKKLPMLSNYRLRTIAAHFQLEGSELHRALDDCILTYGIFEKLKEI
jgi:CRISPR-associated protein Cas2